MNFETEAVSNKRRLSYSVFSCRYIGLELLWSKYGESLVLFKQMWRFDNVPLMNFWSTSDF